MPGNLLLTFLYKVCVCVCVYPGNTVVVSNHSVSLRSLQDEFYTETEVCLILL